MEDDREGLLMSMTLTEGFSFRNLVTYLKLTNVEGIFEFQRKRVTYMRGNKDDVVLNSLVIHVASLTEYIYRSEKEIIKVPVSLVDLRQLVSTVKKNDILRLYIRKDQPNNLFAHIKATRDTRIGRNDKCITLKITEEKAYEIGGFCRQDDDPNLTMTLQEFSSMHNSMNGCKCGHSNIRAGSDYMLFAGQAYDKEDNYYFGPERRSRLRVVDDTEIAVRIEQDIIKAFGKLSGICEKGNVRIYMEPDMPMKIIAPIGSYGTLTVYVKSKEVISGDETDN